MLLVIGCTQHIISYKTPKIKLKVRNAELKTRLFHVALAILDAASVWVTWAGRVLLRSCCQPVDQSNHNSEVKWGSCGP